LCSTEWTGDDCGTLNLLPAKSENGYRPSPSSSWGGKIVKGKDNTYHLYAAFMLGECAIGSWMNNSVIVHTVSENPIGPYREISDVAIVKAFGHKPTVELVKTSSEEDIYLMAHIGCGNETVIPQQCDGNKALSNEHPNAEFQSEKSDKTCDNPYWTGLRTSSSPEGPWTSVTPLDQPIFITNPNPEEHPWHKDSTSITNPSMWSFPNGSILLAYSVGCGDCVSGGKHIGIAYADEWSGPYVDLTPKETIFPYQSEDPCIFVSPETGTFHFLLILTKKVKKKNHSIGRMYQLMRLRMIREVLGMSQTLRHTQTQSNGNQVKTKL